MHFSTAFTALVLAAAAVGHATVLPPTPMASDPSVAPGTLDAATSPEIATGPVEGATQCIARGYQCPILNGYCCDGTL
jgi:hypothetical protein